MAKKSNRRAAIGEWQSWPIDRPKPYPNNARTHPQSQIDLLAELLKKFGPDQPIVVDEHDVILKGHGRRLAAMAAGMTHFPVVQRFGLSAEDKAALRIADNQVALLAGWDGELMKLEIGALKTAGYDISLLAFPEAQLRGFGILVGTEGQADPDAVPEMPKKPAVRLGDLWVLGDHRLLCGDSTKAADVAAALQGNKVDLVFTDPPYNVAYSAGRGKQRFGTIQNDDQTDEAFTKFLNAAFEQIDAALKPLSAVYICHPDAASAPKLAYEQAFASRFQKAATIIWVKNAAGMGWQDYRSQHEPILYGWKKGRGKHRFFGDRTNTTVWDISRDAQANYEHPTQKPVALSAIAIANSSRPQEIVFDPFLGAGGVMIACEMNQRTCIGIELDPGYAQIVIERWQNFTGRLATLNGKTLADVAKARRRGLPKGKADETSDSRKPVRSRTRGVDSHPEAVS